MLDAQVAQGATLRVDGTPTPFTVRADYLVERNGVRAVVEVKTGAVANPEARATRRQILEYAWVYGVSEVYLFDADAQVLRQIGIPERPHAGTGANRWPGWVWLAAGLAAGAAAGWYLAG